MSTQAPVHGAGSSARVRGQALARKHLALTRRRWPAIGLALCPYLLIVVAMSSAGGTWAWAGASMLFFLAVMTVSEVTNGDNDIDQWLEGAEGEQQTARVLSPLVDAGVINILHDRAFPDWDENLDHLVVCRAGIFTIETKNWAGRLEICDGRLFHDGFDKTSTLKQARREAKLAYLALSNEAWVYPLVCFHETELPADDSELDGVRLLSPRGLVNLLWQVSLGVGTPISQMPNPAWIASLPDYHGRAGRTSLRHHIKAEMGSWRARANRSQVQSWLRPISPLSPDMPPFSAERVARVTALAQARLVPKEDSPDSLRAIELPNARPWWPCPRCQRGILIRQWSRTKHRASILGGFGFASYATCPAGCGFRARTTWHPMLLELPLNILELVTRRRQTALAQTKALNAGRVRSAGQANGRTNHPLPATPTPAEMLFLIGRPCPECASGQIALRHGYSDFLGCSRYPSCMYLKTMVP